MKTFNIILIICLISFTAIAEKTKTIERHFKVTSSQRIELKNFSGSKIRVESWDKDEVYIKLKVKATSSDEDWEEEYIKTVNVSELSNDSLLTLSFHDSYVKSGTYFLGIKIQFFHYERKEFYGQIYVPKGNAFSSNFTYGSISLSDMKGDINLYGVGNNIEINNCASIGKIENNYGTTNIKNSKGVLILNGVSSTIKLNSFIGPANINANYSTIGVDELKGSLVINSVSGTHILNSISEDIKVKSNYSTIQINNVEGFAAVNSVSGNISIKKVQGAYVDANYSTINIFSVDGKANKGVVIESTSGNISVEDANGNINIKSPYTDIYLKNIKGNINISGNSSKIKAEYISGDWSSKTNYSNFNVIGLDAKEIKMRNMSGVIYLDLKSAPNQVDVQNQYGNVIIEMPGGYSGEIELTAKYGKIITDFQLKKKDFGSSDYATGKIGNAAGSIVIETQSGNIELNQKGKSEAGLQTVPSSQHLQKMINYTDQKEIKNHLTNFSFSANYQLGRNGEYYGASLSKWIKTWNNEKVIMRGTASYIIGNHWGEKSSTKNYNRIEIGIDSRNTMVTGKDFFNIMNVSYVYTDSEIEMNNDWTHVKEKGWMFSFGFGTRLTSPALVMAKYVWGRESGIRLGIEFDF